jgi:hypothetical protein
MDSPAYLPSVNLTFDTSRLEQLPRFRFSSKNVYLLRQFLTALTSASAERAWSIVGPYGSGKSMFALLIASLFGTRGDSAWTRDALTDLDEIDSQLCREIREIRLQAPLEVVSVGSGETVVDALVASLRDLLEEVQAAPPCRDHKAFISLASRLAGKPGDSNSLEAGRLVDLAAKSAKRIGRSGLLVLFDEFGRTIERGLNRGELNDMQAIQEIAEASNRSQACRVHLLVLLHQSFESYATGISRRHRMEWAKVQGRFRQIGFIEEPEATLSAVADILESSYPVPERMGWLEREWSIVKEMAPFRDETAFWLEMVPRLYPLGVTAAYALPRLASLAGQNERSVYAFLSSEDPGALPARVAAFDSDSQGIRVDELCDYFLLSGRSAYLNPRVQARLAELLVALEKTDDDLQASVVKVIATLAMIGGPLWPTHGAIASALGISSGSQEWRRVGGALASLSDKRVIVYRRYSAEFHLWRGTDLDIGFALEEKRLDVSADFDLASFLNERIELVPYVARRATYETGTTRVFARRFVSVEDALRPEFLDGLFEALNPTPDGFVLYVITSEPDAKKETKRFQGIRAGVADRPIVFVCPQSPPDVSDLALDIRALSLLKLDEEVSRDPVALAEITLRMRACESIVRSRLTDIIQPTGISEWVWDGTRVQLAGQRELQELLSAISDAAYCSTPLIRNELINRHHLSTAVVVAAKKILSRLLQSVRAQHLGFQGNGPEVNIFNALFEQTGWYREDELPALGPSTDSPAWASNLWQTIERHLIPAEGGRARIDDVLKVLSVPPFGIRAGLSPLLVWAVLIANRDSLCLYERGTYLTEWDVELYDRMVRTPANFEVNTLIRLTQAEDPLDDLFKAIPPFDEPGVGLNTLLRRLFGWYKNLPEFSRRTQHVSGGAREFRRLLSAARDPIDMLFRAMPEALNAQAVGPSEGRYTESLRRVISELDGTYSALLTQLTELLAGALQCEVSVRLVRSEFNQLWGEMRDSALDSQGKAFLLRGADASLPNDAWLESVTAAVMGKSPKFWLDDEVEEFRERLITIAHNMRLTKRAVALAHNHASGRRHVSVVTSDGALVDEVVEHLSDPALQALAGDLRQRLSSLPIKQKRDVAVALLEQVWKDAEP